MKFLLAPNQQVGDYWVNQGKLIGIKFDKVITPGNPMIKWFRNNEDCSFHLFGDRWNFFRDYPMEDTNRWIEFYEGVGQLCLMEKYPLYKDTFDGIHI